MTHHNPVHLRGRGDPRALAEYAALHAEISKLTHPARPEPDWLRIENLCTALFIRNGTDLQTVAWFTLALSHQYGPEGLRDGLKVMESQIVTCWDTLWPPNTADRTDILTSLFRRLQGLLRVWDLSQPALLVPLYHCEKYLSLMEQALGEAGLKVITGVVELNASVKRALCRLEGRTETQPQLQVASISSADVPPVQDIARREPLVVVVPAESGSAIGSPGPSLLRPFLAGAAATLAAVFLAGGLWYHCSQGNDVVRLLDATMPPVPYRLTDDEQRAVQRAEVQAEAWISRMKQHAEALDTAETGLAGGYSTRLALQAAALWPLETETDRFLSGFIQRRQATALDVEAGGAWQQGMMQLMALSDRLNALDGKKGRYLTVSELKSAVFAATRAFSRNIPAEEWLRRYEAAEGEALAEEAQLRRGLQAIQARYDILQVQKALNKGQHSN